MKFKVTDYTNFRKSYTFEYKELKEIYKHKLNSLRAFIKSIKD